MAAAPQTSRVNLFGFAFSLLVIAAIGYFSFAAIQGDHGSFRQLQARAQAVELMGELEKLRAEREVLENRTRRLSSEYLDLDLLDEQARKVLGVARADEIVIR
jgi:cell division protein FtsB